MVSYSYEHMPLFTWFGFVFPLLEIFCLKELAGRQKGFTSKDNLKAPFMGIIGVLHAGHEQYSYSVVIV